MQAQSPMKTTTLVKRFLPYFKPYKGTIAFDLCCAACGRTEGFFELGLHIYDIAAGVVILEEAGGKVSGWQEGEDPLKTGNICATNGLTHAFLLSRIRD